MSLAWAMLGSPESIRGCVRSTVDRQPFLFAAYKRGLRSRANHCFGSEELCDRSKSFRAGFDQDRAKRIGQEPDHSTSAESGQNDEEPEPRSLSCAGGLQQLFRFRIQLADFHLETGAESDSGL